MADCQYIFQKKLGIIRNNKIVFKENMREGKAMGDVYEIRTDLALETQEKMQEEHIDIRGVRFLEEKKPYGMTVSTVVIDTENAARSMGKPKGRYITLEAENLSEEDEDYHREISMELAKIIRGILPEKMVKKENLEDLTEGIEVAVLIVGLGNRGVTPDALGPRVVDNMFITRHVLQEFGKYAFGNVKTGSISGIVPGVMAQTGMETVEIIRGVVKESKPDFAIVIDALAARNTKRLGRTIQLSDTGINPGSGVGNHRNAINEKSIGVPVISVGVPTVVDAATIVADGMSALIRAMGESAALKNLGDNLDELGDSEKQELAREVLSPQLHGMFVTPKNIDESVKQLSFTISEALNIAFLGNKEDD